MLKLRQCLLTVLLFTPLLANADIDDAVNAALNDPDRPSAESERDANRKPLETLKFFRLQPDMKVLELIPGGGWYTRILNAVLKQEGELNVAVGTQRLEAGLLAEPGYEGVNVIPTDGELEREGRRLQGLSFKARGMDLVLTFRNLHNFTEAGRRTLNDASFKALKRGGYYGVVDHTRRHMQADDPENWRRMDPVLMIKEIEAAGFEFVDYSNLHYRLDDELRYEVGRRSVSGNTDRFTLLFRKP